MLHMGSAGFHHRALQGIQANQLLEHTAATESRGGAELQGDHRLPEGRQHHQLRPALGNHIDGDLGYPIYWAASTDPAYHIENSCSYGQPPEFRSVRIPARARPDPTSHASMTVYDRRKGLAYGFWRAKHDRKTTTWSACGGRAYCRSWSGL